MRDGLYLKLKVHFETQDGQSIAAWMDALARMISDYMRCCCFHNTGISFLFEQNFQFQSS